MICRSCQKEGADGARFCRHCGVSSAKTGSLGKYIMIVLGILFAIGLLLTVALTVIMLLVEEEGTTSSEDGFSFLLTALDVQEQVDALVESRRAQEDVYRVAASSVVNILCDDGADGSGGSGIVMDEQGLVLTSGHLILRDAEGGVAPATCVLTVPDPTTGRIREMYHAEPVLIPEVSDQYDLAFFRVTEPYTDEQGVLRGSTPIVLPSFWSEGCWQDHVRLGDGLRVFGYPAISADGYYLTVTDGVVSALPNDDTIITSAKVSAGSSGGIAVDTNGCMVGVITEISSDEGESLGIIYSNAIVDAFLEDPLTQQEL